VTWIVFRLGRLWTVARPSHGARARDTLERASFGPRLGPGSRTGPRAGRRDKNMIIAARRRSRRDAGPGPSPAPPGPGGVTVTVVTRRL
jgi:hypothetical protein